MKKLIIALLLIISHISLADPNDPNFVSPDINNDAIVDINDLMILRECFLSTDPNFAYADFNNDAEINLNDLAILSKEWMKESIDNNLIINCPNSLIDIVDIYAEGYQYYDELYLLVDNQVVDSFNSWQSGLCFNLETYCFSNGYHELRIFKYDSTGRAWLSNKYETNFNNKLSNLNAGSFVIGQDYHLTANYDDPNDSRLLSIKVIDLMDDSIVFSTVVDGNLDLTIPSIVFSHSYYNIIIEETAEVMTLGDDEFEKWEKIVSEKFDTENYLASSPVKMVITIPNGKVAKSRFSHIKKILSECDRKRIEYCILYEENCTWQNFSWMMIVPQNVCYWVNIGHGSSEIKEIQRTNIKFYDCTVVSYKGSDTPEPNDDLPDVENKVKSLSSLILYNKGKLKFVLMDTCESAIDYDFAYACGMFSQSNYSKYDQTLVGWADITYSGWALPQYNYFLEDFWHSFGGGDSVYESIMDASIARVGSSIPGNNVRFWGASNSTFFK